MMHTATIVILAMAAMASGCSSAHKSTRSDAIAIDEKNDFVANPTSAPPHAMIPRQTIYRTNGDWNDHVAVRLNPDGSLAYFPGPGDITAESAPIPVADGWLMDRQGGISTNSAFLKWTYAEYGQLKALPSVAQIKAAIIPYAKVTAVETLPISTSEARQDTALVNRLITNTIR